MKKLLVLLPVLALVMVIGCYRESGISEERREFQQEVQSQIDQINQRITEARERSEDLPDDARAKINQTIEDLEDRKVALQSKLNEMKSASSDEWESFKVDVERASQDLESALNNLKAAIDEASSEI